MGLGPLLASNVVLPLGTQDHDANIGFNHELRIDDAKQGHASQGFIPVKEEMKKMNDKELSESQKNVTQTEWGHTRVKEASKLQRSCPEDKRYTCLKAFTV